MRAQTTGVVCSSNGLDVTAVLDYPESLLGGVSAILLSVNYPPPLAIPGSGTALSVRQRVTNLLGGTFVVQPNDRDTDADTVDDQLAVTNRAPTGGSIQPGSVFRVRYDCAAGTSISASILSCVPSQATDPSGLPFSPELAAQINCNVTLSAP